MNAYVNASVQRPPTIPSWFSEMLPLSFDLAMAIQRFRKLMAEKMGKKKESEVIDFIKEYLYVDSLTAETIYSYFYQQHKYSKIPNENLLLVEYFNNWGKQYAIFHSLFGRRVNDALSRALAYAVGRLGGRDIEIGISDNGFYLASLEPMQIERALKALSSKNLKEVLEDAVVKTEAFKRRFRHCAARSLMLLRNYKGRKKSVGKQQMSSHFLLTAAQKTGSDFPVLREAKREVMEDLMDVEKAKFVLDMIKDGKLKLEITHKNLPSPFSFSLILQGKADLMKIEDKIEFLKRMHAAVMQEIKN
jgi:ATP-dependent Lhr-like helicase